MWATARAVASSAGRARLGLGGQGVRAKHSNRAAKRFKKPQFGVSVEVRPLQFPPEEWQAKKVRSFVRSFFGLSVGVGRALPLLRLSGRALRKSAACSGC